MPLSEADGTAAVELARRALEAHILNRSPDLPRTRGVFAEPRGVFVTLNNAAEAEEKLRGCIGFPYPTMPLGEAIAEAAVAAGTQDPRFPPVSPGELSSIVVEVSVLTKPEALSAPSPSERPGRLRIGVDGIIISRRSFSGLLLPQVATEFSLDAEDFLAQGCLKAGLPPAAWLDPETKVSTFQAEVFAESTPSGKVSRVGGSGA